MSRPERAATRTTGHALELYGQLDNGTDGKGMQYQATVKASAKDGIISTEGNALVIRNATEIILYVAAGTDFRNPDFKKKISQTLAAAIKKPYAIQRKQHLSNYGKLFNRVQLSLGQGSASTLTTDKRLADFYNNSTADNELPVLFYQFGRYLLISSTRPGLLPPNLQGLWANQVQTPWNGDYHLDVNVQMKH